MPGIEKQKPDLTIFHLVAWEFVKWAKKQMFAKSLKFVASCVDMTSVFP